MATSEKISYFCVMHRAVGVGGAGLKCPPSSPKFWQISTPYLNPGGRLCPPHYNLAPMDFQIFLRPCCRPHTKEDQMSILNINGYLLEILADTYCGTTHIKNLAKVIGTYITFLD